MTMLLDTNRFTKSQRAAIAGMPLAKRRLLAIVLRMQDRGIVPTAARLNPRSKRQHDTLGRWIREFRDSGLIGRYAPIRDQPDPAPTEVEKIEKAKDAVRAEIGR